MTETAACQLVQWSSCWVAYACVCVCTGGTASAGQGKDTTCAVPPWTSSRGPPYEYIPLPTATCMPRTQRRCSAPSRPHRAGQAGQGSEVALDAVLFEDAGVGGEACEAGPAWNGGSARQASSRAGGWPRQRAAAGHRPWPPLQVSSQRTSQGAGWRPRHAAAPSTCTCSARHSCRRQPGAGQLPNSSRRQFLIRCTCRDGQAGTAALPRTARSGLHPSPSRTVKQPSAAPQLPLRHVRGIEIEPEASCGVRLELWPAPERGHRPHRGGPPARRPGSGR